MRPHRRVLASTCVLLALAGCGSESTSTPASFGQRLPIPEGPPPGRTERVIIEEVPRRYPLTDAIGDLEPGRVKFLLDAGADANARESDDATSWPPLALAMR